MKQILSSPERISRSKVLVAAGIIGVITLVILSIQTNKNESNTLVEFQLKRTQLHHVLIGQFLNEPNNCECLFKGAADFPVDGIEVLKGVSPIEIGRYDFGIPGDCPTARIPLPVVNTTGIDGLKSTSIELRNVTQISGSYSGNFVVKLQSTNETFDPLISQISIPVIISTVASSPGKVAFQSCSLSLLGSGTADYDSGWITGTDDGKAIGKAGYYGKVVSRVHGLEILPSRSLIQFAHNDTIYYEGWGFMNHLGFKWQWGTPNNPAQFLNPNTISIMLGHLNVGNTSANRVRFQLWR